MANFNEHALEMSIMELFKDEGYIHLNGSQIHRERTEVLLQEDLKQYLYNRYAKDGITPGEEVWMCYIDIYAINHDGNLFDAANLAAVAALKSAVVPGEQYGKGPNKPLPVTCTPISVTAAKLGNTLIVDPDYDEEQISSARLTVTTDDNGNFRAMQKGGCGSISLDELSLCLDRAVEIGAEIRKIIG